MILIFGGAYQGKTAFAKETFGLDDAEIACCTEAGIPADVPEAGIKAIARLEQALLGYIKKDGPVTGNDDPAGETPAAGFLRMYKNSPLFRYPRLPLSKAPGIHWFFLPPAGCEIFLSP